MEEKKEISPRDQLSKNQRSLIERIEALALVYSPNAREIPQNAWQFWFDAAKGSTLTEVKAVISDWSKSQSRMMTPSDMYKVLQTKRINQREAQAAEELKQNQEPIPQNIAEAWKKGMANALSKDIPNDAWARRDKIKEAYGFMLTEVTKQAWRKALNLAPDYSFEDTNGAFPLEQFPDERRSLYHDCRIHFMREYQERHGLRLVYDKELATKRYTTHALRYHSCHEGTPAREAA